MTVYGNWGSYAHHSARLPPTPPEYQTSYLLPSESTQAYYPKHQSKRSRHKDVSERYFSAHSQNRTKHHGGMDYQMNYPQPLAMPFHYGQPAPMLPPIQVPDEVAYQCQYTQQVPENKSKEEKPTGGVAQYLDYDMDMMSNFVAEMCQQMVTRVSSSPTAQFRKYVCQILSSTRLPSSTIMLGLFYLQERMKFEKGDLSSSGSLMKMLTTCLLLGSKFLDDNTFQNRSWAEVSNISVHELNSMELQWLKDFNWEIHSLMYDPDEGFFMWVEHWHNYEEKAQYAQAKQSHKLAPINTNITRMSHIPQPMMSPEGPIPPQYQQGAQYDTTWARAHLNNGSPPSSHHSGPTTPEYYAQTWQYGVGADSFGRPWNHPNKASYASHCQQVSPYYSSHFGQGYQQVSAWSPRGAEYYMPHMGYHSQTVVG